MVGLKRFGKPHLTFYNGLWAVLWPELAPHNLDDIMKTWGWVLKENTPRSAEEMEDNE